MFYEVGSANIWQVHIYTCYIFLLNPSTNIQWSSLPLQISFRLKSSLSENKIATPSCCWCLVEWNTVSYLLTFSLWTTSWVRWVPCIEHTIGFCFLIRSASLCLLTGKVKPFTLKRFASTEKYYWNILVYSCLCVIFLLLIHFIFSISLTANPFAIFIPWDFLHCWLHYS